MSTPDPHAATPLLTAGPAPESADATLILLHGRGASAEDILSLYHEFNLPTLAALAPQAAGHTWYPNSFLAPIPSNQPYLDSALRRLASIIDNLLARGIPAPKVALLGFSQGACLTSEFAARNPRRYGTVIAFTGGLIGPPITPIPPTHPTSATSPATPRTYPGSLDHTPIFLGSSDPDPHVPFSRVQETAATFTRMGAHVDLRRYPGMPHTINQEELQAAHSLLSALLTS